MAPPKRPWFRWYVEMFSDFEIRALTPAQRWTWGGMLGMARMSPVPGVLLDKAGGPATDQMISDFAAVKVGDVKATVRRMLEVGSLRRDDAGALVITKWDSRQFESDDVASRTAKHRAGRNVPSDTDVTANGTAGAPGDGTVPPSVVLPEVHRTELLKSSSSQPLSRPAGSDEKDSISGEVWRLLAQFDAEAFAAKGGVIRSKAWFATAAETRRTAHEHQLVELAAEHAEWTPDQLAQAILDGSSSGLLSVDDQAGAAQRARMEEGNRRLRGEACGTCSGSKWVWPDGDPIAHPCPTCRPDDARLEEAS